MKPSHCLTDIQDADGLFDLILESVGGSSLASAVRLVAPEGTIVVFGNTSGEDTTINFQSFVGHQGARLTPFFSYLSGSYLARTLFTHIGTHPWRPTPLV